MSKRKRNILLLIGVIILYIVLFEISLRLFSPQRTYNECYEANYGGGNGISHELDNKLGWNLKPSYSNCDYQHDTNKIVWREHNSQRLRLPYEVGEKEKQRIILLGDSFVYGSFLDDSETIYSNLKKTIGEEYEIIPMGVEGFGTGQEFIILEEGMKYKPDIVILFFYQNDFQNTISEVQGRREKPFFTIDEQGNFYLANSPISGREIEKPEDKPLTETKPISTFILRYSHAYALWYNKKGTLKENIFDRDKPVVSEALKWGITNEWDNRMQYATIVTLNIFNEFKKLSEEEGFEFVVVNIPFKQDLELSIDRTSTDHTDEIFDGELNKIGITYISLVDFAKENYEEFYFRENAHWSPGGVELTANYLTKKLKDSGILQE